jgi:predicted Ser/Thr protein kinase
MVAQGPACKHTDRPGCNDPCTTLGRVSTLLGARVAGYTIEAVAGRGGMGVVYRARDTELERTVALKVIAPDLARDEGFRARFVREARVTAQLDHPNVIPVYDAGDDEGRLFIAMRWVEGTDLGRLIHEQGALEPEQAADLVAQAASALDAAHAQGLVHRDVKPANLLLPAAARTHVYLTDFGLAKRDGSNTALTTTGHWLGTPDYAAPEQIEGRELDARADVYALGCVLYAALTGRPPFADVPRLRKGWAQVNEAPPALRTLRPAVPAAFEPVVAKALAKDPAERHASAGELGEAACAAAAGEAPRSGRTRRLGTGRTARLAQPQQRPTRRWAAGAAAVLVLAIAATAIALTSGDGSDPAKQQQARTSPSPPSPLPAPSATAVVRCAATTCTQAGRRVQPPIEQGRCGSGSWARIDAGSPPLIACIPDSAPARRAAAAPMPDLAGARLDRAEHYLDQLGIRHDTSGGGTFGVIESDNWQVCATTPPAGASVAPSASVKVFVDRSC